MSKGEWRNKVYNNKGEVVALECPKCRLTLPVEEFYYSKSKGTYYSYCKQCSKKVRQKYEKTYRDKWYKQARYKKPEFDDEVEEKNEEWAGLLCPPRSQYAKI